jgi:hypothetical protein
VRENTDTDQSPAPRDAVRTRILRKAGEFVRREAGVAFPAAKRAASHGLQAFINKFSEEYARERRKRRKR